MVQYGNKRSRLWYFLFACPAGGGPRLGVLSSEILQHRPVHQFLTVGIKPGCFFIKILKQHSLGLDSDFYLKAGLRIRTITLIRIRIRASLSALMRIRIWLITLMRIRILLLTKVRRICDHRSKEPPWLHFEPLKLLNFDFNAETYPASL
jgi:hypothetical protein